MRLTIAPPPLVSAALIESVLETWFGTTELLGPLPPGQLDRWFRPDPAFDATLAEHFGSLVVHAADDELDDWEDSHRGALALVILLDQLPRNIYRDTAKAYAADPHARAIAEHSIAQGYDRAVGYLPRMFFYLPFEHAEDLALQDRAMELFRAMASDAPPELAQRGEMLVGYAAKHREVIARFGRFPHRNAALGRESTPDEAAFIAEGRGF